MAASWECPSLPMISLPMKETAKTSFLGIKPMISAHYEENPDSFGEEIKQLDQLRESAMRPSRDYNGCSVVRRYFSQLHLLRARFPPETIGQLPIDFTWKDVFTGVEYVQEGLQVEQASVLYNLAALHSVLGCKGKRDNEQEMKEAITHFQCAAGAFSYLDEKHSTSHVCRDLTPQFIALFINLMLAQAQECLVEKSLKGIGRVKNLTIAKLATRVAEYYIQVVRAMEVEPCNVIAKKNKDWAKLLKIKVAYFQTIAHFYHSACLEEASRFGETVAMLLLATQRLTAVGKVPKSLGEPVKEALRNLSTHLQEKLGAARRQNDQVYHEPVPELDTLETVQGVDLVKPLTFHPTDPKNLGTDILARLIPMRAHEAASVYSEDKAKLVRSLLSSVQDKDSELEQFMQSLNAGEMDKLHEGPPTIPEDVLQQHKVLSEKPAAIKQLHTDIEALLHLSEAVSDHLAALAEERDKDTEQEQEFQARVGSRPASQLCATMWKDVDNNHGYHKQASKSNVELKAMFDQHHPSLLLLSGSLSSLQAAVPTMTPMDAPPENPADADRWQELLGKIDKMKRQRKMLVSQFRDQVNSDDITKTLVGHLGPDRQSFIDEQMAKHREIADIIRQNLAAQENILMAVMESNARQVGTREAAQKLSSQQESFFSSLSKSASFLPLLQSKIREGLGFYMRLHDNVSKLRKRAVEILATRNRERENVIRRRTPPPESPPSPSSPPSHPPPGPTPPRPPKKAELSGKPLPPADQKPSTNPMISPAADLPSPVPVSPVPMLQIHPGPIPVSPGMIPQSQPEASAISPGTDLDQQLLELQKNQQLQLQQIGHLTLGPNVLNNTTSPEPQHSMEQPPLTHALLEDRPEDMMHSPFPNARLPAAQSTLTPTSSLPPPPPSRPLEPTDFSQPPEEGGGQLNNHEQTPRPSPDVPEASQALLDLQMLLQPPPPPPPALAEDDGSSSVSGFDDAPQEFSPPPTAAAPIRPVKPVHLQSQTTPYSPPPDNRQQQSVTPLQGDQNSGVPYESRDVTPPPLPPPHPRPLLHSLPGTLGDHQPPAPSSSSSSSSSQFDQLNPIASGGERFAAFNAESEGGLPYGQVDTLPLAPPHAAATAAATAAAALVGENTITINSISRPIPAAVQSPPAVQTGVGMEFPSQPQPSPLALDSDPKTPPPQLGVVEANFVEQRPTEEDVVKQQDNEDLRETVPHTFAPSHQQQHDQRPSSEVDPHISPLVQPPAFSQESQGFHTPHRPSEGVSISSAEILPRSQADHSDTGSASTSVEPGTVESTTTTTQPFPAPHISQREVSHFDSGEGLSSATEPNGFPPTTVMLNTPGPLILPSQPVPTTSGLELSAAMEANLRSFPLVASSLSAFQPLSMAPLGLPTPPTVSPLSRELATPLSDIHPLPTADSLHFEAEIAQLEEQVRERDSEIEREKTRSANQKSQMDGLKQQVFLLEQQITQMTMLQQKQEQDKAASSGQQAVLMQLLQQQQGMFSQQQAQIEKLSQVGESHRREQLEAEVKFKQSLAVEQERKASLQNQVLQQNQELQRLHQQIQTQSQQYQNLQLQLYQYHTQIQERDKQLVVFRDQHKQIMTNFEQKHQQKISQLVQQVQELQATVKKYREQQRAVSVQQILPAQMKQLRPQGMSQPSSPAQLQPIPQQQQALAQNLQPASGQHPVSQSMVAPQNLQPASGQHPVSQSMVAPVSSQWQQQQPRASPAQQPQLQRQGSQQYPQQMMDRGQQPQGAPMQQQPQGAPMQQQPQGTPMQQQPQGAPMQQQPQGTPMQQQPQGTPMQQQPQGTPMQQQQQQPQQRQMQPQPSQFQHPPPGSQLPPPSHPPPPSQGSQPPPASQLRPQAREMALPMRPPSSAGFMPGPVPPLQHGQPPSDSSVPHMVPQNPPGGAMQQQPQMTVGQQPFTHGSMAAGRGPPPPPGGQVFPPTPGGQHMPQNFMPPGQQYPGGGGGAVNPAQIQRFQPQQKDP